MYVGCCSSNLEQTSVRKLEHTNHSFKVLTKISHVELFLTLVCSSHWKQWFVGQPPSNSLGADCVNYDSCLQQGCSCRDFHIWTPWPELKRAFSKVFPEISPFYTERKASWCRHLKSTSFVQNLQTKQWREREREEGREICSARIRINTACSCWEWEGCLHLLLGTVCDSLEQMEEGCWR